MYKLLLIILLKLSSTFANADYFQGIKCSQNVSELDGLILDTIKGANFEKKEYRLKEDTIKIGEVKSSLISYLFWKDQFLGIAVDIFKKDDFNEIINYFNKTHGASIWPNKNRKLIWISEDEVIIVNRFSTHLAQVQIFCKKLYNNMHGISDK